MIKYVTSPFLSRHSSGLCPVVHTGKGIRRLLICGALLLLIQTSAFAAVEAPKWLKQAAAQRSPNFPRSLPAAVLYKERSIQVEEGGKVITVDRHAVRILSVEGKREALGVAGYTRDTGKVRDVRGWVISPNEEVKKLGKEKVIDRAAAINDVY